MADDSGSRASAEENREREGGRAKARGNDPYR